MEISDRNKNIIQRYENLLKLIILLKNKKIEREKIKNNKNKYLFLSFCISISVILYCFHRRNKHSREMFLLKLNAEKEIASMQIKTVSEKYNLIYNGLIKIIDMIIKSRIPPVSIFNK